MKISAPIGYEQITPLTKGQRIALPRAEATPTAFQRLHAIPLSLAEFEPACRDYPIVFVSGDDGLSFSTMAVLGLQESQNLFIMTDGAWDRRVYLPAYVRRYPFCMAKVSMNGEPVPERLICVESSALNEKGEMLHGPDGRAQPRWASMEKLIVDYENDLARSEELAMLLAEFNLLEPFSMRAEVDGFTMQLEGMHRVTQGSLGGFGRRSDSALDGRRLDGKTLCTSDLAGQFPSPPQSAQLFRDQSPCQPAGTQLARR